MKVLVADDSSFVRSIIIKSLNSHFTDLDILIAADGKQALDLYNEQLPELIITDLLMPEMTGQEFLKAVKTQHTDAKAIVVSADIQNATKEELESIGVLAFINKPLSPDKITQLMTLVRGQKHAE